MFTPVVIVSTMVVLRILETTNPQVYVETPLNPEKLTVWCALWAGGIIGPFFFKNDEGRNVTVNGDRYRAMITNFFIPELNNHDVQELWFQQDGATCHTARATIDLLKDTFESPTQNQERKDIAKWDDDKFERTEVHVVHSVMVFKMCERLGLQAHLAAESNSKIWIAKKKPRPIPKVHFKTILMFCETLNLDAKLAY
ncbi:putative DD41D transposase [Trichonephila clavipes]|uniref:Putative DD41D transposase n=1 Tax=Trichonephila clavipes TaxID=2585209 RepID=A0A8X6T0R7_TRICX|nr:putative DD41D transposase [Trichonephila clavipes]